MSQHFISPETAKELIDRYRANVDKMTTPPFQGSLIYSELFDASAISALLQQEGCESFRAYFGMNEENKVCCVFYGVDASGKDIVDGTNPIIIENGDPCPPKCP